MFGIVFVPELPPFEAGGIEISICHVPPGNPANAHTITVGAAAVPKDVLHRDSIGVCGGGGNGGSDGT